MNAPVDVTNVQIETPRLLLRPFRESDVEDLYAYASVDGVGQMAGWKPHASIDESRNVLNMFIREKKTLALVWQETGTVIGSLGLETIDKSLPLPESLQGREIGYALSKDYWGRGLMPEAVKAVIDFCFHTWQFDYLTCGHFLWNHQSRRVVEKCGFTYLQDCIHRTAFGTEEPTKLYVLFNPNKVR